MPIISRLIRLWKADLHGVMDQLEDKNLLLKQYLREMETSLHQKEQHLTELVRSGRRADENVQQRKAGMAKLEQDLELALRKENDDIARLLIRKRRSQEAALEQLEQQNRRMTEERSQLQEVLTQQRMQYDQLKVKADIFGRQAEQNRWDDLALALSEPLDVNLPSDEEVELELMQRKEALKGGAA